MRARREDWKPTRGVPMNRSCSRERDARSLGTGTRVRRLQDMDGSQSLDLQHAAGRGRRRRPRLPRLRVRRPRRPTGARQLRARAPDGRRARRLEARPPRPQPRPPGQHRAGPVDPRRGPAGAHRARRADRHHHRRRPPRVRYLRGAGRVRAGADPRTHPGLAHGRAGARPPRRQEVRAVESPGAAGPGRDGAPRHLRVRALP